MFGEARQRPTSQPPQLASAPGGGRSGTSRAASGHPAKKSTTLSGFDNEQHAYLFSEKETLASVPTLPRSRACGSRITTSQSPDRLRSTGPARACATPRHL